MLLSFPRATRVEQLETLFLGAAFAIVNEGLLPDVLEGDVEEAAGIVYGIFLAIALVSLSAALVLQYDIQRKTSRVVEDRLRSGFARIRRVMKTGIIVDEFFLPNESILAEASHPDDQVIRQSIEARALGRRRASSVGLDSIYVAADVREAGVGGDSATRRDGAPSASSMFGTSVSTPAASSWFPWSGSDAAQREEQKRRLLWHLKELKNLNSNIAESAGDVLDFLVDTTRVERRAAHILLISGVCSILVVSALLVYTYLAYQLRSRAASLVFILLVSLGVLTFGVVAYWQGWLVGPKRSAIMNGALTPHRVRRPPSSFVGHEAVAANTSATTTATNADADAVPSARRRSVSTDPGRAPALDTMPTGRPVRVWEQYRDG